jgi:DNA helicase HerA-like ATPase
LQDFAKRIFRNPGPACTWAIDEAPRYRARKGAEYPTEFYRVLSEGRHHGIGTILVAQLPTGIPHDARSLADSCVAFRLNDSEEIRRLRAFYGDQAPSIGSLAKYHSLRYTAGEQIQAFGPIVR